MPIRSAAFDLLADEADALLTRLNRIKPFVLQETMTPAGAPWIAAQTAIDGYLARSRWSLRRMLAGYRCWLAGPAAHRGTVAEAHRRFTFLRLQFNALLTQTDIFSQVVTQRSEGE